jgi:hypothetical protein
MMRLTEDRKSTTTSLGIFICLTIAVCAAACGGSWSATATREKPTGSRTGQPSQSAVRKIDFRNFAFPKLPTGKCSLNEVRLRDGKYDAPADVAGKRPAPDCWSVRLGSITYGDVTGDNNEEAIVELYAEAGGTEASEDVFIYTEANGNPVLLWQFATGDRADGGLRRIAAENGELVIDLFGVGTAVGKKLYGTEAVGACCPKHFTRTKYKWDGSQFQQDGSAAVFDNPSESSAPVTSPSAANVK